MDDINPDLAQTDVALVVGANDVVNPAARHDKNSPIFGMPIIDVDKAKTVIAIKRSMNPGFAGIDNELYYLDHTLMAFGDAKQVLATSSRRSQARAAQVRACVGALVVRYRAGGGRGRILNHPRGLRAPRTPLLARSRGPLRPAPLARLTSVFAKAPARPRRSAYGAKAGAAARSRRCG